YLFFSSRRRHTRFSRDWSSDVCSSDLMNFDRGFFTVTLAHITFSMCFVAVVVQSRLLSFDRSLEEAAMDLGATSVTTFIKVTLRSEERRVGQESRSGGPI